MKVAQKNSSNLLKELATLEAAKIKADKPKFCVVHKWAKKDKNILILESNIVLFRKEGDGDFIAAFIKELDDSVRTRLLIMMIAIVILFHFCL